MNDVREGRFIHPNRAPQIYVPEANPAERYLTTEQRGAQEELFARVTANEATIAVAPILAYQAHRLFARFAWSREPPGPAKPEAPGEGKGSFYEFVVRMTASL